jgi:hypothetical protein
VRPRPYISLSSSSPIIFDGTLAQCFFVHLHNNVSTAKVKNVAPGVTYTFVFHQDAKGGHVFSWPSACRNPSAVGRNPGQTSVHNYIGNDGGYLDATMPRT